jgi:hypothetical protein
VGQAVEVTGRVVGDGALPVYVIHYRAPLWCQQTVDSLRASTIDVDVTVVDNGGLGSFDPVRVLRPPRNLGFSGGANVALASWLFDTDAEWCLVTSHDLSIEPDCLEKLLEIGARHPAVGLLAPNLGTAGGRDLLDKHEARLHARRTRDVPERLPITGATRCSWVSGSCMLIRRPLVDDIGPFDERYGSYAEDVDFGFRANRAGWDVALVGDAHATTFGTAARTTATTLMVANAPFGAAKNLGPTVMARGLARNLARAIGSTIRIVTSPRSAADQVAVASARLRGWAMSVGKVVSWYAHVVRRRLAGLPPVDARCHDERLLARTGDPPTRR